MPRKHKTEQQQARQFALILPVILAVVAGLAWWREHPRLALGLIAGGVLVPPLAFALPGLWLALFRGWMKLANGLSFVMTRVILTVFFFLVLTPFGLVMRLFGKRPLDLAWKNGRATYWIDKEPGEYTLSRYEKQF